MRFFIFLFFLMVMLTSARSQALSKDDLIAGAVSAAPEPLRDGATVLSVESGITTVLREGTNDIICLSDEQGNDSFSVTCYHKSLEPYMARGRELRKTLSGAEARQKREQEARDGKIPMPKQAALYSLRGSADIYNPETKSVEGGSRLYVLYTPFATEESTGFPTKPPVSGGPWLMRSGEPSAHVMIPIQAPK